MESEGNLYGLAPSEHMHHGNTPEFRISLGTTLARSTVLTLNKIRVVTRRLLEGPVTGAFTQ